MKTIYTYIVGLSCVACISLHADVPSDVPSVTFKNNSSQTLMIGLKGNTPRGFKWNPAKATITLKKFETQIIPLEQTTMRTGKAFTVKGFQATVLPKGSALFNCLVLAQCSDFTPIKTESKGIIANTTYTFNFNNDKKELSVG